MTAVIYARYSSDNQREESIEGQIRECTAYAEKNGITVIKHYIDRAFSAKTDNRPEFQQMIKDSGKKLFDVVLVWKFDRFARNRFDSANYKMILKKNGVHLISVMEPIAEGSQGILVETLLEGMAEYYSAELSEKVIRGQTENALKGKCTGGTGTIGYKIDEDKFYHLDPLTAPLVLEAFQRYDNGDKMVEIVNFLNDKGVRNMLGGKMTHSSVNTMLKNRRYIGELSFRDIVVPDAIPVIVPKDLFDRVQKRLDKNKRAPACGKADEEYLLTTKLFCGKCGALMFGESGTSATGRTYYYYKCANVKRRKGCNKKTVQKDWLEDLVVRETMKLIQDDAVIDKIVQLVMDVQNQENTTIPLLEKQLREVNKKLDNLMKAIEDGLYTRTTKEHLEALEIQKDELNSYKSQVKYYTELIKSKPEWSLAGIYADEAITGTQVKKREDFQRLINDCMNGDVDMVITKSISRFARNTLDTLKYVRMLKDKGVAVFFEEENINTLTMDGELLLVILSSVAQQEVENISANVKKGLKMKMQRGELVGFQGCLGYDYNPEDKTLTVNEEEAAVVRYIFQRYTEGAGGSVIAKELENLGYKTKRGSPKWADSTVIGIIKNEKYKGDILLGKTFTVDPISKRRLYNFGEEDQFYIREHHEPIISEEVFEAAQEILRRRAKPRSLNVDGKREKFSRKYAFSCMIECGFCGGTLTRRSWHSSSQYNKAIWQCVVSTKKGKKFCPESKGVDERTIERAFVESYRLLCQNNKDVLDEFMKRTEEALSESNAGKRLAKAEKDIHALEVKKNKLVDMRLEDTIDKETYDRKYLDLSSQIEQLQKECESLQDAAETESTMRKRVATFRQTLEQNEVLDTFDRHIFESIVEKVIVGGYDSNGNKDPYMIVFVYKTGFKNSVDGKNFKPLRKNSKENHSPAVLCSHASNEAESMCSDSSDDTCRSGSPFDQTLICTAEQSHGMISGKA